MVINAVVALGVVVVASFALPFVLAVAATELAIELLEGVLTWAKRFR